MPIRGDQEASRPAIPDEVAPGRARSRFVVFTGAAMTDPHHVLGVPAGATNEEITRAYHRLVRQHHPDTTQEPTEPERFRAVVAAYAALRGREPSSEPTPPPRDHQRPAIRVGPVRYHGPPGTA
jgi:hypothetical protein